MAQRKEDSLKRINKEIHQPDENPPMDHMCYDFKMTEVQCRIHNIEAFESLMSKDAQEMRSTGR